MRTPRQGAWPPPTTIVGLLAFLLALLVLPLAPRAEAFIYWTNNGDIGRANRDGTRVDERFITSSRGDGDVEVHGNHIYWTWGDGYLESA